MSYTVSSKAASVWNRMVHAPFKKVVAFDLLCIALGMPIGAGILAAFLYGQKPLVDAMQTISQIFGG